MIKESLPLTPDNSVSITQENDLANVVFQVNTLLLYSGLLVFQCLLKFGRPKRQGKFSRTKMHTGYLHDNWIFQFRKEYP